MFSDEPGRVGRPRKFCSKRCYESYDYDYPETDRYHDQILSKEITKVIDDVFNDNNLPSSFRQVDFIPARRIVYYGVKGKEQSRTVQSFNSIGTVSEHDLNRFIKKSEKKLKNG